MSYIPPMNKSELIEALSARFASKADATRALEAVLGTISHSVASGDRVVVTGFGTFERVHRPARRVRNPSTGATMMSSDTHVVRFRPGGILREQVASGTATAPAGPAIGAVNAAPAASAPAPAADVPAPAKAGSKKAKDSKKDAKAKDSKDAKGKSDKKSKKDDGKKKDNKDKK